MGVRGLVALRGTFFRVWGRGVRLRINESVKAWHCKILSPFRELQPCIWSLEPEKSEALAMKAQAQSSAGCKNPKPRAKLPSTCFV